MNGFLKVLQKIEHGVQIGVGIARPFVPLAAALVPGGALVTTIFNNVLMAEAMVHGTGAEKKAAVTAVVNEVHPNVAPAVVSVTIDEMVALMNAAAARIAAAQATADAQPKALTLIHK